MITHRNLATVIDGASLRKLERTNRVPPEPDAVLIEAVARGSAASLRGLRAGDIVLGANRKPVHSEEELISIAENADRMLILDIQRDDGRIAVLIQ